MIEDLNDFVPYWMKLNDVVFFDDDDYDVHLMDYRLELFQEIASKYLD